MRKFSLVFVAAMLLSATSLFANDAEPNEPKNLAAQIGDLLEDNRIIVEGDDLTAKVVFTLNEDKEIVVLTVDTDNRALELFIKSRLNYEKVNFADAREGKTYTVPLRITA